MQQAVEGCPTGTSITTSTCMLKFFYRVAQHKFNEIEDNLISIGNADVVGETLSDIPDQDIYWSASTGGLGLRRYQRSAARAASPHHAA